MAFTALPASAAPLGRTPPPSEPLPAEARGLDGRPDSRCDLDQRRAGWMRRFERAALLPELGVRASVDTREAALFAWIGWPLDRPPPRGLAGMPSASARREGLAERAMKLRRSRAQLSRERRVASLRDAVDAELDLEEVDAELAVLEECP